MSRPASRGSSASNRGRPQEGRARAVPVAPPAKASAARAAAAPLPRATAEDTLRLLNETMERAGTQDSMHTNHSYITMIRCSQLILSDDAELQTLSSDQTSYWRRELWQRFVQCRSRFLCEMHETPFDAEKRFCFGSLLFTVVLRLSFQLFERINSFRRADGSLDPEFVGLFSKRAQDIAYCVDNRLCPSADAGPVIDYSMGELMTAISLTRHAFTDRVYNPELLDYCQLLEICASRFIHMNGTIGMFDMSQMRVQEPMAEDQHGPEAEQVLYSAAPEFLDVMWPSFLGMQRDMIFKRTMIEFSIDEDRLNMAQVKHDAELLRYFVLDQCRSFKFSDTSPTLKRCLMNMYLRPGERELSMLVEPGGNKSDAGLVSASLGSARVINIQANSMYPPVAGIRLYYLPSGGGAMSSSADAAAAPNVMQLMKDTASDPASDGQWPPLERYEPLAFGFCMQDFLKMSTDSAPGASWSQLYSRCEADIEADMNEVQNTSKRYPMVCQLFNAWQLVYRGRVYWFNSLTYSLCAWLRLLELQARQPHSREPCYGAAAKCRFYRAMILALVPEGVILCARLQDPRRPEEMEQFICDGRWA